MKKIKKRSVQDIPIFLDRNLYKELKDIVESVLWDYKTNRETYQLRDQAFVCLLILSGLRISEALQLRKKQFRIYDDKIVLANVKTLKRGLIRQRITLPKKGNFAWFTNTVEKWLTVIPTEDSFMFPSGTVAGLRWNIPLSRKRPFWIIKTTVNKFPHWFRGVCETVYGRIVFKNNAWKLKDFMGLKRLDSTTPYVMGPWEEDEERIYDL